MITGRSFKKRITKYNTSSNFVVIEKAVMNAIGVKSGEFVKVTIEKLPETIQKEKDEVENMKTGKYVRKVMKTGAYLAVPKKVNKKGEVVIENGS